MALNFLSGGGSSTNVKHFDIRLDSDYVVFRGNEQEASSAHLRGKLVLCLTEPMSARYVTLTLSGISRTGWVVSQSVAMGTPRKTARERQFFEKVWTFKDAPKGKTENLKADNYEWPFDLVLEGSLPESIEGLADSWIIYRFKAEIGRKYTKDIIVRKPLRIIRTLDSSALELAHAMSVENIWPNKIEYSISTPTKAVVFGTSVRVDFRLIPLLKGLKLGLVRTEVLETWDLTLDPDSLAQYGNNRKDQRTILVDEHRIEGEPDVLDEVAEGFEFSRYLELPKTLRECVQDVDVKGIKIRHKLKFNVQLHNPDGHTSELRATLPVSLILSPNLPLDDNNDMLDQRPVAGMQELDTERTLQAPPLYGEHQLDQLYSDVDHSGYRTPAAFSTPGTPLGTRSRNISSENLHSLDSITEDSGHVSASALQTRLQDLHIQVPISNLRSSQTVGVERQQSHSDSPPTLSRRASREYFSRMTRRSRGNSPGYSPPSHSLPISIRNGTSSSNQDDSSLSRSTTSSNCSDEHIRLPVSGMRTPAYLEISHLSRVPSYTTAVRTPARETPISADLPTYGALQAEATAAVLPSLPQNVHARGSHSRRSPVQSPPPEDARQLRIAQARARA